MSKIETAKKVGEFIVHFTKKNLPSIKVPSHIVYMKRFPRTANGKLDETVLRELCLTKIAKFLEEETLAKETRKLMAESNKRQHR